ncbi:MAG: hypothetical protein E7655_08160 [Ruminococcaceae bacterium]|nr:hypothetical protein [Oscillospiraceae bacterium]
MKNMLSILKGLLPHAVLILSLMMITFYITDQFNRPMAFINNDITKALLFLLSLLAIVQSVYMIRQNRK